MSHQRTPADPRPAAGVWTLDGGSVTIADGDGPATLLVPTEDVRLLAVDLPLPSRAKRIEALPFAVEEMIADSLDAVHLVLGAEIAPKRYLVGVVRHERMEVWAAIADEAGLGAAAIVPDALALPQPDPGEWAVQLGDTRAVVRAGDGTGFALPAPVLRTAWDAAGRPAIRAYGAPLPEDMGALPAEMGEAPLTRRLANPALDLRTGIYARRRVAVPTYRRRLAWVIGLGIVAHASIAVADTLMLRAIADRRQDETRLLVATAAPGTPTNAADLAGSVADMLPEPGRASAFLPLVTRVSGALAPVASAITVRSMRFEGSTLILDLDSLQPGTAARITAALADARITGRVVQGPGGTLRLTATGA
ncbi:type II secretion system protein GspL [Sphingomonas sp. S1-29]|uniref:type II secretion system protein GspL n=1 Tax=Sphingomonas sp. S1-29 TaxID=2991074 RepID=UPI00223FBDDF|nr:type II secretion system protein GspL [Sphingomonas sp. S1-29]UZK70510.1 type II secretion system protein GspL [Sphingomonas sp. S1-29]